jgi:hypothetical protein
MNPLPTATIIIATIGMICAAPIPVFAGQGKVTQAPVDPQDPNAKRPLSVSMSVHVAFPASEIQTDDISSKLSKAARLICDATDGAVLIDQIELAHNGLSAQNADIIWYPQNQISQFVTHNNDLPFGHPIAHVRVADQAAFRVVAHEIGHLLFGLEDSYDRQRYFGGPCGVGPAIDEGFISPTNHTIMQAYNTKCYDTLLGVYGAQCNYDIQCPGPTNSCYEFTDLASEFSTAATFEGTTGTNYPDPAMQHPGMRSGDTLWLDMEFGTSVPVGPDWLEVRRDVEYISAGGKFKYRGTGDSHVIKFRAQRPTQAPSAWRLQAWLEVPGDPPTEEQLMWSVAGSPEPELVLEFSQINANCGDDPVEQGLNYHVDQVNGAPAPWDVRLELPGALLGQAALDVSLAVDLDDTCEHDDLGDDFVAVSPHRIDALGHGTGGYIGVTPTWNNPSSPRAVFQQLGVCPVADLQERWNHDTQRWENSSQLNLANALIKDPDAAGDTQLLGAGSDWEFLTYNLSSAWPEKDPNFTPNLDLSGLVPNGLPSEAPGSCANFFPEIDDSAIESTDTIALLIDRSGSMAKNWQNGGHVDRRIDWAKKGAEGFAKAAAASGQPIQLALVGFNGTAELISPLAWVDETPNSSVVTPKQIHDMLDSLEPKGGTAIGDAIAYTLLHVLPAEISSGRNNAIFLLTDGESHSGIDMQTASTLAQNKSTPIFVSPIGSMDASALAPLGSETGGALLASLEPDQIPAGLFQMRAAFRGEQLSLPRTRSVLSGWDLQLPKTVSYEVDVETGAERLLFMLSPRADVRPTWDLKFELHGPNGEIITQEDLAHVSVEKDRFYYLVQIPSPSRGVWTMRLNAPKVGETPKVQPEAQTIVAHIEHAGPRCIAHPVTPVVSSPNQPLQIMAEAEWNGLIGSGVNFSAIVRAPVGAEFVVPMEQRSDGIAVGVFDDYLFDGVYEIEVTCDVPANAAYALDGHQDPATQSLAFVPVPTQFERTAVTSFTYDADVLPPLIDNLDCDGDGVVNHQESKFNDGDGDGVTDICDPDADGDDWSDGMEASGDTDGDGVPDKLDSDADDDGDSDGHDWDPTDPAAHWRYAQGDLNGDGLLDLIWGEPDHAQGRGRVLVKYAGERDPEAWGQDTIGILGTAATGDHFGAAVTVADFDHDGHDDVAVGVPGDDDIGVANGGAVHIIYGSSTGLTTNGDQCWTTDSAGVLGEAEVGDHFGARLASGDFNGDAFMDLVIGVPDESVHNRPEAGVVHVLHGSGGGLSSVNDLWVQGGGGLGGTPESGDRFGETVATADFNADTFADLVIGAPTENWNGVEDAGNGYVIYGSEAGLDGDTNWMIMQGTLAHVAAANDEFATRVWAEDHNDDGYADLIVMTPGDPCGPGLKGFNYIYGGPAGLSTLNNVWYCREFHD